MYVIVDRFEENYAVCEKEDKEMIQILKKELPPEVKEGDVLQIHQGEIAIDQVRTKQRAETMKRKMESLWE